MEYQGFLEFILQKEVCRNLTFPEMIVFLAFLPPNAVVLLNNEYNEQQSEKSLSILNGSTALQILLYFGSKLSVETVKFLVESHISLVDIVNIRFIIKSSPAAILRTLV